MAITSETPNPNGGVFAYQIVGPEIDSMTDYATEAYDKSVVFIDELLTYIADNELSSSSVTLADIDVDIPATTVPTIPTAPTVNINLPNLPP